MQTQWVGSWTAAQQIPDERYVQTTEEFTDTTLRQIVQLTLGGGALRLRVSNAFGAEPLYLRSVRLALSADSSTGSTLADSDRPFTFSRRTDVIIPPGADYLSDILDGPFPPFCELSISLYLEKPPSPQTGHPGARQVSFLGRGDQTAVGAFDSFKQITQWYFISAIEVLAPKGAAAIAVIGDSLTDGRGSQTNSNKRWPNLLARRLQANVKTRHLSVLNAAAGGNRVLLDGIGPNAMARLDRDVFALTGLRYLIVFEGVNDLGLSTFHGPISQEEHRTLIDRMITAYEQIVQRCHAKDVMVIGATLAPFGGSTYYQPTADNEADRQRLNAWIRAPDHFDGVIDFDEALRDPQVPERLRPAYDCGDHLDPSPEGYQRMTDAVPLSLFEEGVF